MNRREFLGFTAGALALPGLAGSQDVKPAGGKLRLSVTWGMMRGMPPADALNKLDELGYDAYEMFDWRNPQTLATFAEEHKKHKLECSCLIANKGVSAPGCGLTNPAERDQFLKEMEACAEACKAVDCKQLLTLTGNEVQGMSHDAMFESCVAGLKAVAPLLEKNGLIATVELLNTYHDHRGYFLNSSHLGARMVEAVGSPNVKLLYDIYHMQIMEGDLIFNIRQYIGKISHFHIGDVPGRHQPGTGEINYRNVFKAIVDLGYSGTAALEYGPTIPYLEDLANMRQLTMFV